MTKKIKKSRRKFKLFNIKDKALLIPLRYIILLFFMFSLPLIYFVFTPLAILFSSLLLKIFYSVSISNNIILIDNVTKIEIISACVAGSAYLFLLILNLLTQMQLKKRINTVLFSFSLLLTLNILRIFFLSILYHENNPFFDFTHKLFWFVLSTLFVVFIWFFTVRLFKISEIPVYSDVLYLMNIIKKKR
jgi:exosortase/archaeosortase family protein